MIHGFLDCKETFFPVEDILSERFNIVSYDMRGHGDSAHAPDHVYTYQHSLIDLKRVAERFLPQKYSLLGHSYGAAMAARFAGLYPEKIRSLVLFEGFSGRKIPAEEAERIKSWFDEYIDRDYDEKWMKEATLEKILKGLYPRHSSENLALIKMYLTRKTEKGFRWKYDPYLKNTFPMPFPPELSRELWSRITCPVFLAMGKNSHLYPPEMAEILGYFKNVTFREIPDAGHNIHHDQPDALNSELSAFFRAAI